MKRLVIVVLVLALTGCAAWVKTEGPVSLDAQQFAVDPPQGWMRRNNDKVFLITRDGLALQTVVISRFKLQDEKQFNYTKRRVTQGMLPQEIAEVIIDDYQSDADNPFEAVEENAPDQVGGKQACRLRLSYLNKGGLKYRCQIYGFLAGDWFYRVIYTAPARHYFDKDLPAVQEMVKSFRLLKMG